MRRSNLGILPPTSGHPNDRCIRLRIQMTETHQNPRARMGVTCRRKPRLAITRNTPIVMRNNKPLSHTDVHAAGSRWSPTDAKLWKRGRRQGQIEVLANTVLPEFKCHQQRRQPMTAITNSKPADHGVPSRCAQPLSNAPTHLPLFQGEQS
jgi:hypothetical protein